MLTASMITYQVDEEKKTVTATVTGTENDALECVFKGLRKVNIIADYSGTTCRLFKLPNVFTAKAKYDPNDPNPFTVARGKEIARRRLYDKYNLALMTTLQTVLMNIEDGTENAATMLAVTNDRWTRFKYYDYYCIKQAHLHQNDDKESEK